MAPYMCVKQVLDITRGFIFAGGHFPDCDSGITRTYIHDLFMKFQIHRYSVAGIARSVKLLGEVRAAEGRQLVYRQGQGSLGTARPSVRYASGGAVGTTRPSVRYAPGGAVGTARPSVRYAPGGAVGTPGLLCDTHQAVFPLR